MSHPESYVSMIARLTAETERLRALYEDSDRNFWELARLEEARSLKAENERLQKEANIVDDLHDREMERFQDERTVLLAENERLRAQVGYWQQDFQLASEQRYRAEVRVEALEAVNARWQDHHACHDVMNTLDAKLEQAERALQACEDVEWWGQRALDHGWAAPHEVAQAERALALARSALDQMNGIQPTCGHEWKFVDQRGDEYEECLGCTRDTLRAQLHAAQEALAHEVSRNHEHTDACSVCALSDALLAATNPPKGVEQ